MYPFYEKILKAGITTVCIHKGLLPADYEKSWPGVWQYTTVWDVGKAAKDWPKINFVIYHGGPAALPRAAGRGAGASSSRPAASTGSPTSPRSRPSTASRTSTARSGTLFANSAVANPRVRAAFMGTLIRGLGADHVRLGHRLALVRLAAVADRGACGGSRSRADMQKKYGFAPLGAADGPVKTAIFARNSARLYRIDMKTAQGTITGDKVAAIKAEYTRLGGMRSNARYGYVHRVNA